MRGKLQASGNPDEPIQQDQRKRVTVMISGRGSNMSALIAASMKPDYPAIITQVISNREDAAGLETAAANKIPTKVFSRKDYADIEEQEAAIMAAIEEDKSDFICLAGYMRILSENFVRQYRGKILNIHPSLLPSFTGLETHARALSHGVRVHGCTVHFVDEQMDEGAIIGQACVPVLPDDDEETLAARVLVQEHLLYPAALRYVAMGKIRLSANSTVYSDINPVETFGQLSPFHGELVAKN